MNTLPRLLEISRKYAVRHRYPRKIGFRHAAVLVSGGRIISVGYNGLYSGVRFDPALAVASGRFQNENHAECACCERVKNPESLVGAKIYVSRISAAGRLVNSRPCRLCQISALHFGISRIIYSVSETEYGTWISSRYGEDVC